MSMTRATVSPCNTLLLFLAVGGGALALFALARIAFGGAA